MGAMVSKKSPERNKRRDFSTDQPRDLPRLTCYILVRIYSCHHHIGNTHQLHSRSCPAGLHLTLHDSHRRRLGHRNNNRRPDLWI